MIDPENTCAPIALQHPPALARARDVPLGDAALRLLKRVEIDTSTGCWIFTGGVTANGYGQIRLGRIAEGNRRLEYAHRLAYEVFVGPIPDGYCLDHLCRRPSCVFPNHLQPVTQAEKVRRGDSGLHLKVKTHCPQGHPYSEENTSIYRGGRFCRHCRRDRSKVRYQRIKGSRP